MKHINESSSNSPIREKLFIRQLPNAWQKRQKRQNSQRRQRQHTVLKLIYCLLFFAICLTPLAGFAAGFATPNLEKRSLAPKPELYQNQVFNTSFVYELDDYFSDHFPFRSYLISAYHQVRQAVFSDSGSDRVITGQQDWLFYAETLDDYLRQNPLSDLEIAHFKQILALQSDWLKARNIEFLFTVAPNKNSLYGQYMPNKYQPFANPSLAEQLNQFDSQIYLDLFSPLSLEAADQKPLYHFTDSHWNNLGARIAAEALLKDLAGTYPELALSQLPGPDYQTRQDWVGDLAVMLYPSGPEAENQQYFFDREAYRYVRPLRSLEDMLIQTRYQNGQYRLHMFRDSFANALIPLLSHVFGEASYSRSIPYDYRQIDQQGVDIVIAEIVERNIRNLLQSAPIMPADPIESLPLSNDQATLLKAADDTVFLKAAYDHDQLKISGWFHTEEIRQAVRVLVGFPNNLTNGNNNKTENNAAADTSLAQPLPAGKMIFYEAFPIVETMPDTKWQQISTLPQPPYGMTLYLDIEHVKRQSNEPVFVTLYLETIEGSWYTLNTVLQLPES